MANIFFLNSKVAAGMLRATQMYSWSQTQAGGGGLGGNIYGAGTIGTQGFFSGIGGGEHQSALTQPTQVTQLSQLAQSDPMSGFSVGTSSMASMPPPPPRRRLKQVKHKFIYDSSLFVLVTGRRNSPCLNNKSLFFFYQIFVK